MDWNGARYADSPTVDATTHIDAPPERVWELVSDPLLMPDLSSELHAVEWLDGAMEATVGARFRGHNKHDAIGEWSTTCQIMACDAPRVFSWAVEDPQNPTATWGFELAADGGGTLLRQWARMGPGRSGLSQAIEQMPDKEEKIVYRRMCEFEQGIIGNLEQIKQRAEAGA